jgi:hypothetical protein
MDTTLFRKLYPELVHCNRSLFKKALKPDSQLEVERLREHQKASSEPRNRTIHTLPVTRRTSQAMTPVRRIPLTAATFGVLSD